MLNNLAEQWPHVTRKSKLQVYHHPEPYPNCQLGRIKIDDASCSKFATPLVQLPWRNAMNGVDERNPGS
ncbi:unnamed protein product [Tuber melanosporum]|uniref:(Perigord truffle) hypothetical protein n=1 Tax=Tuber melanosporum (strain Mel28) TaxID=656061 RepID=D5GG08_TUBMM|nr:uncharacterized protein GSTUM_00007144001 [Tuber melanosporum]CAZ83451.1 unnamed protein product [Tuber melanosporum]